MEFFTQAVDVLKVLVMAVGAGLGAWGVINLIEGYGNDNPGSEVTGRKTFNGKIKMECLIENLTSSFRYFYTRI